MKALTMDLIHQKTKTNNIHMLTKLNLWGVDLTDVSLVGEMQALQVLSLSVNNISNLEPFQNLRNLQELYLRRNNIADLSQLSYLTNCRNLRVLWLSENPISNVPFYREMVIKCLPSLEKLDDREITDEERQYASSLDLDNMPIAQAEADIDDDPRDQLKLKRAKTTNEAHNNNFIDRRANDDMSANRSNMRYNESQFTKKPPYNYDQTEGRRFQNYGDDKFHRRQTDFPRNNRDFEADSRQAELEELRRRQMIELEENQRKQALEEQIREQMRLEEELRQEEAYRQREELKRQELYNINNSNKRAFSRSPDKLKPSPKPIKNDNVTSAVLMLLGELNEIELEIIKSECEKKLDGMRLEY